MFQGRRLCKISLLVVLIIAFSAYSPWDFLGLYDKAFAVEQNLYDGMALLATGTVSRKEIKTVNVFTKFVILIISFLLLSNLIQILSLLIQKFLFLAMSGFFLLLEMRELLVKRIIIIKLKI